MEKSHTLIKGSGEIRYTDDALASAIYEPGIGPIIPHFGAGFDSSPIFLNEA